jgi:hypothetical protein
MYRQPIANTQPTHSQQTHQLIGCFAIQASGKPEKIKAMMTTTERQTDSTEPTTDPPTHTTQESSTKTFWPPKNNSQESCFGTPVTKFLKTNFVPGV